MPNYAVIDKNGNVVSFGTEVASTEELAGRGLEAVEIDYLPGAEDTFDKTTRKVRKLTEAELDERDPSRAHRREREGLRTKAKATGATNADKLNYLIALLES